MDELEEQAEHANELFESGYTPQEVIRHLSYEFADWCFFISNDKTAIFRNHLDLPFPTAKVCNIKKRS